MPVSDFSYKQLLHDSVHPMINVVVHIRILTISLNISATLDPGPDQSLIMRPKHIKVMHLNTQSMVSAFDELLLTIKQYPFDVISMSETLKAYLVIIANLEAVIPSEVEVWELT